MPDGQGIFARRFAEDGTPLGDAFGVNTFTTGDQAKPRLDMNDSGQFVITWESLGQDGNGLGHFCSRVRYRRQSRSATSFR